MGQNEIATRNMFGNTLGITKKSTPYLTPRKKKLSPLSACRLTSLATKHFYAHI